MSKLPKNLRSHAWQTRRKMESLQKQFGYWDQDLGCMCFIASHDLFLRLKRDGYKPAFCINEARDHCFIMCGGYIIDVTATQMSDKLPKVMVRRRRNLPSGRSRYWKLPGVWSVDDRIFSAQAIFVESSGWPTEQKPLFVTNVLKAA